MSEIPIDPTNLPTEEEAWDESVTYKGVIIRQGRGIDKNENAYINIRVEVMSPDAYEGATVGDNYIPIPRPLTDRMKAGERRKAINDGVRMARLLKSASYTKTFTEDDPPELEGCEIEFMVKNEPFANRLLPKIDSYLF